MPACVVVGRTMRLLGAGESTTWSIESTDRIGNRRKVMRISRIADGGGLERSIWAGVRRAEEYYWLVANA